MTQRLLPAALLAAACSFLAATSAAQSAPKPKHLKNDQLLIEARTVNGLGTTAVDKWHVKARYETFDEAGKHKASGVFEEWHLSPNSYKSVFTSDDLKQTDIATSTGLFRSGDQRWTTAQENLVPVLLSEPIAVHPYDPRKNELLDEMRAMGQGKMRCVFLLRKPATDERAGANLNADLNATPSFCFEADSDVVRYGSQGNGRQVLLFNDVIQLGPHNVAREIHVLNGGKQSLEIHVLAATALPADAPIPTQDAAATGPLGGRIQLASDRLELAKPIDADRSDMAELFTAPNLSIKLVIGKDGHVLEATMATGPHDLAGKTAKVARKAVFVPFTILGTPVEVETTYSLHGSADIPGAPEPGRGRR